MRVLPAPLVAGLLLLGCSGEASAPAPASKPLLFEARKSGGSFALFLNDTPAPKDLDSWARILGRHARLVDDSAGFAGLDAKGHSENQVIFSAPPDAPSGLFIQVLERLVEAKIVKIQVELSRPGHDALRCALELARDESLGPNRDNWLIFKRTGDAKNLTWQVRMAFRGKSAEGATGQIATTEDWADEPVRKRLEALLRSAEEVSRGFEFHDATVAWEPSPHPPAWGAVYEALAVIAELNAARGRADDYTTIISTSVYEYAVPPQLEAEAPPESPDTIPQPAPKDMKD